MRDPNIDTEDREVLNTMDMVENNFFAELAKIPKNKLTSVTHAVQEVNRSGKSKPTNIKEDTELLRPINTEKVILSLYDVHDSLIELFKLTDITSELSEQLVNNIDKVTNAIRECGIDIENFDPLANVSGLKMPNLSKNAELVIDTTKACYSLGKIEEAFVDKNTINIVFGGNSGKISYRAKCIITASNGWNGNEALDYIYTPGSGKLSVKTFENNAWADRSNNYQLSWELDEFDPNEIPKQIIIINKKEASLNTVNNIAVEEDKDLSDINDDFEIKEK